MSKNQGAWITSTSREGCSRYAAKWKKQVIE